MKSKSHVIVFCALAIGLFAVRNILAAALDLNSERSAWHDVSLPIFGFNTSMSPSYDDPGNYHAERVLEMLDLLPAHALRYPGGTVANYFDCETEMLQENAIKREKRRNLEQLVDKQRQKTHGRLIKSELDSFVETVNDMNLVPFIVLNIYSSSAESAISCVKKINKKLGGRSVHWELGNELSYIYYSKQPQPNGSKWDVNVYRDRAKQVARFIKSHYPKDKVGIVGGEVIVGNTIFPNNVKNVASYMDSWDSELSGGDWFDAVIYHPYIFMFGKRGWERRLIGEGKIPIQSEIINSRKKYLLNLVDKLPDEYEIRFKKYYAGKEMWITESGIDGFAHGREFSDDEMSLPLAQLAYLIHWTELYDPPKVYVDHVLSYGKAAFGFPLFFNNLSLTINGSVFNLLKDLLANPDEVQVSRFNKNGPGGGEIYAIRPHGDRSEKLLVVNTTNATRIPIKSSQSSRAMCKVYSINMPAVKMIEAQRIHSYADLPTQELLCNDVSIPPWQISYIVIVH